MFGHVMKKDGSKAVRVAMQINVECKRKSEEEMDI